MGSFKNFAYMEKLDSMPVHLAVHASFPSAFPLWTHIDVCAISERFLTPLFSDLRFMYLIHTMKVAGYSYIQHCIQM